jgi:hypothetical protein
MPESSFKVADGLFLVRQTLDNKAPAKPVETPTNHILVIDCSGSMYNDLPQIRGQLKKKLPKMLKETDTISIIWFSGSSQFGVLLEAEPVATLTDLKAVEAAIDRWLRPTGLTSFEGPLNEAAQVVARVSKARPGSSFSLIFMSDGCDNCSRSRADIFKAVEAASGGLAAATFVEYGFYADRPLLTAMAERAGGSLIFAESFDKYEPLLEAALAKKVMGGKRVECPVKGDAIGGFVWEQNGGDLVTYGLQDSKASVPEQTTDLFYLAPTLVGTAATEYETAAAYAALSLFSVRAKPEIVLPFLRLTGDVAFIKKFGGLFGKQKYSEFMDAAKAACFDATKRLVDGCNPKLIPADDAFTVLDMLQLLASDEGNRVMLDSPSFKYNRIGRARVDANTVLTKDEMEAVAKLTAEMGKLKDVKKIAALNAQIAAITTKPEPLKFESAPSPDGYAVSNLTYNEQNPNISIQVRREGTVDISKHVPESLKSVLPAQFPTGIFRNYAVVKDGLVNVKTLPVKLSATTMKALFAEAKAGRIPDDVITVDPDNEDVTLLNFDVLPIINRKMVKAVSAKTLFESEWSLLKAQAAQKVYNSLVKELVGTKKSATFEEKYGKEGADWLKEAGFADYGFNPKMVQGEARDFYMAKELKVAIKSFSSIPSLNEFKKQATKGKYTPSAALMTDAFKAAETFLATTDGKDTAKAETWLKAEAKKLDRQRRDMIAAKAQQVFSIIVGQVWFTEFASIDENTMTLTEDGQTLECRVEMNEVKVEI